MVASLSSRLPSYPIPCGKCLLFEMLSILMSWAGLYPSFSGSNNRSKNYCLGARMVSPLLGVPSRRRALSEGSRRHVEVIFHHHDPPEASFLSLLTMMCVLFLGPSCLTSKSQCLCRQVPIMWPYLHEPFSGYGIPWPLLPSPQTPLFSHQGYLY